MKHSLKPLRLALLLAANVAAFATAAAQSGNATANATARGGPVPTFAQVVTQYFSQWDTNGDGTLTPEEIDAAVANPNFHGEPAAAIAAIKMVVRGGKYALPPLTEAYLVASPLREPATPDEQTDQLDDPAKPGRIDHPPAFQPRYRNALRRVRRVSRVLFAGGALPSLDACHQGPLGDCYFVSVVGAMVYRDPSTVQSMITQNDDGSYTIAFGDGQHVQLAPLTDAEIAVSSSAGANGLWLTVLENAYGELHVKTTTGDEAEGPDTDSIAHGGSPAPVIRTLDGHQTRVFGFVLRNGQRRGAPFAATMQEDLTTALREHRLVASSTPRTKLPPGVTPGHVYAVLGFDRDTGLLHLWNPHGNNFTPKGPDGRQNGYTTKAGQFDIPMTDWLQLYHGVTYETETPFQH